MSTRRTTYPDTTAWCEELVLELRLRNVRGTRIGDEVAAVESHCAESGQSAQEAFGDVRAYAASLTFGPDDVEEQSLTSELLRGAWPTLVGLGGFYVASWAATGWAEGGGPGGVVSIGLGQVTGLLLVVAAVALIVHFLEAIVRHVVLFVVIFTAAVGSAVLAARFLDVTLVRAPFGVVAAVAALLLAVSVVAHYRSPDAGDPVVDPVDGTDRYASRHPRVATVGKTLGPWFWVLASAALFAVTVALG